MSQGLKVPEQHRRAPISGGRGKKDISTPLLPPPTPLQPIPRLICQPPASTASLRYHYKVRRTRRLTIFALSWSEVCAERNFNLHTRFVHKWRYDAIPDHVVTQWSISYLQRERDGHFIPWTRGNMRDKCSCACGHFDTSFQRVLSR